MQEDYSWMQGGQNSYEGTGNTGNVAPAWGGSEPQESYGYQPQQEEAYQPQSSY